MVNRCRTRVRRILVKNHSPRRGRKERRVNISFSALSAVQRFLWGIYRLKYGTSRAEEQRAVKRLGKVTIEAVLQCIMLKFRRVIGGYSDARQFIQM